METRINEYLHGMAEKVAKELLELRAAKEKIIPRLEKSSNLSVISEDVTRNNATVDSEQATELFSCLYK